MASYEIRTRIKPDLPRDNWAAVFRVAGIANTALAPAAFDFLEDLVPRTSPASLVVLHSMVRDEESGAIYVRFEGKNEGTSVLRDSTSRLLHGIRLLDLDVEIQARMDSTDQLSPTIPLPDTYGYMKEVVTDEVIDIVNDIRLAEPEVKLDISAFFRVSE